MYKFKNYEIDLQLNIVFITIYLEGKIFNAIPSITNNQVMDDSFYDQFITKECKQFIEKIIRLQTFS
jgi:hypothetical protein